MKCVVCRHGGTRPGIATLLLQRAGGDQRRAGTAARAGARIKVRAYKEM